MTLMPPSALPDPAGLSEEARAEWRRFYPAYIAAAQAVWQMGYDAGWQAAEADMADAWADVARRVRALAHQPTWSELQQRRAADQHATTSSDGRAAA